MKDILPTQIKSNPVSTPGGGHLLILDSAGDGIPSGGSMVTLTEVIEGETVILKGEPYKVISVKVDEYCGARIYRVSLASKITLRDPEDTPRAADQECASARPVLNIMPAVSGNEIMELWRDSSFLCAVSQLDFLKARFFHILESPDYREEYLMWTSISPGSGPGHIYGIHFPATGAEWDISLTEASEQYTGGWCTDIRREVRR